jgi:hypothetical protein
MFVKTLSLVAILFSGQSYAQGMMEVSLGDRGAVVSDYLKDHFSASYHGEMYAVRRSVDSESPDEHNINDFKIMHNPTLIYKAIPDWQVAATAEFKFSDQPSKSASAAYPNGFYRGLLTLTRKNILNEKENGIQLDAGIGRRQFNTGSDQMAGGKFALSSYGNNRVFATVSKTHGKHNASIFVQYLNNDIKTISATSWKNGMELIPNINIQLTDRLSYLFNDDMVINTPKYDNTARKLSITHDMNVAALNFQWNDKISNYYQFKYEHGEDFTNAFASQDDYFINIIGVGYNFNPKTSVAFEASSEAFHARDGRSFMSKNAIYPELALYIDIAM